MELSLLHDSPEEGSWQLSGNPRAQACLMLSYEALAFVA